MIVRAKAPLRISLGGGGSELPPYIEKFGGLVLNATINKYAFTTIKPADGNIEFRSYDQGCSKTFDINDKLKDPSPQLRLHRGVYSRIMSDFCRGEKVPITLATYCDVPVGSGLGTSSTITVSLVKALDEYLRLALSNYEIADLAHRIEREDLGLFGGLQDHYAATFGGFNFIEFLQDKSVTVNSLRIAKNFISELEYSIILWFSGVTRDSGKIIEESVSSLKDNDQNILERTHRIKASVPDIKNSILKSDLNKLANLVNRGWQEKKLMQQNISSDQIDEIYDRLMELGAMAARVSGAGGGGYLLVMCTPECRQDITEYLADINNSFLNFSFTNNGAESWVVNS